MQGIFSGCRQKGDAIRQKRRLERFQIREFDMPVLPLRYRSSLVDIKEGL